MFNRGIKQLLAIQGIPILYFHEQLNIADCSSSRVYATIDIENLKKKPENRCYNWIVYKLMGTKWYERELKLYLCNSESIETTNIECIAIFQAV